MKILIIFTPDPVYMNPFIQKLVERYSDIISGVVETQGSITKKKSKIMQLDYFLALTLILGIKQTIINTYKVFFTKKISIENLTQVCEKNNIIYKVVKSVNSNDCLRLLDTLQPDIIFNQSQHIIKKETLNKAKIGFINRHGALLPKYRGRLAPFWQILNKEKFGGLTFHFIDEKIDNGKIIKQYPIEISKNETVSSLINKMFELAIARFGDVIQFLQKEDYTLNLIENKEDEATYFTSPTLKDALRYRFGR